MLSRTVDFCYSNSVTKGNKTESQLSMIVNSNRNGNIYHGKSFVGSVLFRLQSVVYPLFTEPTHMVVFDIAFKRETYFDGSFGVLLKVFSNVWIDRFIFISS